MVPIPGRTKNSFLVRSYQYPQSWQSNGIDIAKCGSTSATWHVVERASDRNNNKNNSKMCSKKRIGLEDLEVELEIKKLKHEPGLGGPGECDPHEKRSISWTDFIVFSGGTRSP
uniref:Uncharacterized protein n=1 Tax=Coccidioides posadasii RMSCC 3488 TaxID=454284 RepID=A0A0J6I8Z8_COCPO|nr:hypothetical protein CPAG_04359 [Coccidioides posadasii RMSCC 3488]